VYPQKKFKLVVKKMWRWGTLLYSPSFGDFHQYEDNKGNDDECYQSHQKVSDAKHLLGYIVLETS